MVETEILPYFKIGYEINHKCQEEYWENLELFFVYRTAFTLMMLSEIDECGVASDMDKIKKFFTFIILQDNIFDGMTLAMKGE